MLSNGLTSLVCVNRSAKMTPKDKRFFNVYMVGDKEKLRRFLHAGLMRTAFSRECSVDSYSNYVPQLPDSASNKSPEMQQKEVARILVEEEPDSRKNFVKVSPKVFLHSSDYCFYLLLAYFYCSTGAH